MSLLIAFIGGLVSFASPCVLPVLPGFLSYLAGLALKDSTANRRDLFLNSVYFVLGFTLIFAVIGLLLNSFLAGIGYELQVWLARAGGALVVFFGLYLTGIIKLPLLDQEHKLAVKVKLGPRSLTSFALGMAFALGWTPCIGPVLGSIIVLAATNPAKSFVLMLAYSAGLGVPFLLVGFFTAEAAGLIGRYAKYLQWVRVVFGLVLVLLGILLFTQNLNLLANFGKI